MNRVKALLIVAVLVVASAAFAGRLALAQTREPAPQREADPIAALTAEFRALRTELSAAAAASLRLQLLVARLQAQEQRILYLDRVRLDAATRRSNVEQGRNELARQMERFTGAEKTNLSPEERRDFEPMVEMFKTQLAQQERTLQQIQVEENDAASALAQEQGRWNDFNARLDEVERSLSQR